MSLSGSRTVSKLLLAGAECLHREMETLGSSHFTRAVTCKFLLSMVGAHKHPNKDGQVEGKI